ncbi:RCC1 domain-containing protein [Flavobacterium sp. 3-218]
MRKILLLILILSFNQIDAQCWKSVASGATYTVAITTNGTIWSWGDNRKGQLGIGSFTNSNIPNKIGTDNDWKTVSAGQSFTVALKTNGTLWAWGDNFYEQLCDGTRTNKSLPVQIGTATDWATISAGDGFCIALKTDGTLWGWGNNYKGQLGDGTNTNKNTPTQIGTANDWQTIETGSGYSVAIKKDGTLWAWGSNSFGQLGDNTTTDVLLPKKIGTSSDWKTISAGVSHTMAIKTDGSLWGWGESAYGNLGSGSKTDFYVPTKIGIFTDWKTISCGGNHTIAIKTNGSLWGWGYNPEGELGNGANTNVMAPTQIGSSTNYETIAAGFFHTVVIDTSNSIWTAGRNAEGQLGEGTFVNKNVTILLACPGTLAATTNLTNLSCLGDNIGSASIISVNGGTAPYTYLWSNGKTTASITDLKAGIYTCTITDATSLSITKSFDISQPTESLSFTFVVQNADCSNVSNNGNITINASGGTKPYEYSILNPGIFQESNVFTGLPSGIYEVMVKDQNGCLVQMIATIDPSYTPPPTPLPAVQTFNNTAIVANLRVGGNNLKFFTVDTEGIPVDLSTPLQTGKYYVSQTDFGCESARAVIDVTVETTIVGDQIPTNGLIAYYPFSGNANDTSGNRLNASVSGATLTTDRFGNNNSAYSFNGVSNFINVVIPNIPQSNSSRTISGWFKTDDVFTNPNKHETCIFNYGALEKSKRLSLYIYSKGYLETITGPSFSSDDFYVNNYNYSNNDWYFFTLTYDGTKLSLYVNGKFVDEKAISLNTTNNIFRLGEKYPDNSDEWFKGKIDDVAIWNRVLTPEEISALYTPGEQPSYTLIPDPNFEQKLINLRLDSGIIDGKVPTSNINTLKSLDVSNSNISDLTGIQDFVSLTNLNCSQNSLKALNVNKNTALIVLNCNNNQIAALDVSNNTALTELICYSNKLTSLDVKANTALTKLDSGSNQYTTLDVSSNTALTFLGCNTSQLTSLDVSNNTALTLLDCRENKIKALDVSNLTALKELYCQSNQLKDLDVSKNKSLELINCSKNQLTTLDISAHPSAIGLYANSNQLTSLNLKNGNNINFQLLYLNLKNNPNLSCIQVDDATFSNANWSTKKDPIANFNTDCVTSNLYTYIPDVNFENKLIALGIDSGVADGKVLTSKISSLTSLDVSASLISDLTGIQDFTSLNKLNCGNNKLLSLNISNNKLLKELNCRYNDLTTLDVSANTGLTSLDCIYNHITTLDVSNMVELQSLLCTGNQITNLDVTKNLHLYWFGCNTNKLETLDVSQNKILQYLDCGFNQLTSLDISNNTALFYLNCYHNKLTSIDVSMLPELTSLACSANQLSSLNISKNVKLNSLLCEDTNISTLDISANTGLKELFCGNGQLTTLDVSKNKALTRLHCQNNKLTYLNIKNGSNTLLTDVSFIQNPNLNCIQVDDVAYANANWPTKKDPIANFNIYCEKYTLIPDLNFEKFLITKGIDSGSPDGKVLTSKVSSLTELFITPQSISSLSGIQDFISLETLHCDDNQLTSIDVSNNINLESLSLGNNKLTDLDVSKNTALRSLYFYDNQIATIDVSKNTALEYLYFPGSKITDLDISKNTALRHLTCSSNLLTTLDLSQNTALETLLCDHNQLTELDISKNTLLGGLQCNSNKLTALNTSTNTNLVRIECDSNKITHLDTSNNPLLSGLNCNSNLLTTLDISKNTSLDYIKCASNQFISLNLKNGNNINFVNTTMVDNLKNNPNLTCIQVDDVAYSNKNWMNAKDSWATYNTTCTPEYVALPDTNFEQKLIDLGIDTDGLNGKITIADASSITSIDLSNSNIKDLTGIEYFTSLTTLNISNNQITSLDVSNNLLLETLDASSNQLTTLDLSKNTKLTIVYVVNNPLVYLNLRNGNNRNFVLSSPTTRQAAVWVYTSFLGLTSLSCIQVDDENYSNANWSNIKESTTAYSNTCKSLGVDESTLNQTVVYPNPTKGVVNITNISLNKATVYNSLGQLVKSFILNNANTDNTIDLSGLPRGVYYVYLINGDAASAKKVIVE